MNVQLKRGLLEACVLTALYKEDSYGYDMIKKMSQYIEISETTLYPILKRLETADCLTVYNVEHNSRIRKYYKITQQGKERVKQFLDEWKEVNSVYKYIKEEIGND